MRCQEGRAPGQVELEVRGAVHPLSQSRQKSLHVHVRKILNHQLDYVNYTVGKLINVSILLSILISTLGSIINQYTSEAN